MRSHAARRTAFLSSLTRAKDRRIVLVRHLTTSFSTNASVQAPSASSSAGAAFAAPSSSSSTSSSINGNSSISSSSTSSATSGQAARPPPPTAASLSKRRNTDLALILSGTLGLSALLFFNIKNTSSTPTAPANLHTLTPSSKAFTLPVHTPQGVQFRTITMLTPAKVNDVLTANERSYSITRPGNPLTRYDTNSVASNETCEDAQSFTILEHDGNDYILASMFDGHAGYQTSRLLAERLEKYIGRELFEVLEGGYKSLTITGESWWNWLWTVTKGPPKVPTSVEGDSKPEPLLQIDERGTLIPEALRQAYKLADRDIIQPPLDFLETLEAGASGKDSLTITEAQRKQGLSLLAPALSGSCALSALIDTSQSPPQLYVALAGDSRAVMGTYDETTKKWRVDVLSEDQTGRSPKEIHRMKSEHPKSEQETVIMRGRVLGGLEPTRSFGDAKYKWPVGIQEKLIATFRPSTSRTAPPSLYKTPPYVTAEPEVTVVALPPTPSPTEASATPVAPAAGDAPPPGKQPKRFIVMATDGLYDCLSSEEVVGLVAAHLDGNKTPKSRTELFTSLDLSHSASSSGGHKPRNESEHDKGKRFVFDDQNLSTHLIRNALGGAQKEQVSALLSIPAPNSRRYRDDITINVMLLGDYGPKAEEDSLLQGVRRIWTTPQKAKL